MVLLTLEDSEKNPKTKAGEGGSSGLEEYTGQAKNWQG